MSMNKLHLLGSRINIERHYHQNDPVDRSEEVIITGEFRSPSDGYHTFDELYDHRVALFKALMWSHWKQAWASKLHADGSMFDGWFIAGIHTPEGDVTYHLPIKHWEELFMCRDDGAGNNNICIMTLDRAPEWDGHTPKDVINRLKSL